MDEQLLKELVKSNQLLTQVVALNNQQPPTAWGRRHGMTYKDQTISVGDNTTATRFHGVGSLFGEDCALERDVISAVVRPEGLLSRLPAFPTLDEHYRVGAITGLDPDETAEANYPCENAPRGTYSACRLGFDIGRIKRDSNTIEIADAIMRANRGDTDFLLRNSMTSGVLGGLSGPFDNNIPGADVLNVLTLSEMQAIGVAFQRVISRMLWTGDVANSTANGGYIEFNGLDLQITTGIQDVVTQELCPNMDSLVHDFNCDDVCDATLANNIVTVLSQMERRIRLKAQMTGLSPVKWVLAMHPDLWEELSSCWPCMYHTDRCSMAEGNAPGDNPSSMNDEFNIAQRDAYRNGMWLPINGIKYEVVADFGIPVIDNEDDPQCVDVDCFASSIYFIPLTVLGGWPVTYMRYLDFRAAGKDLSFLNGTELMWTDDGRYMWSSEQVNFCYEITGMIKPGLVFRAPHLAFRVDNVQWCPLFQSQSPYPEDDTYIPGPAPVV